MTVVSGKGFGSVFCVGSTQGPASCTGGLGAGTVQTSPGTAKGPRVWWGLQPSSGSRPNNRSSGAALSVGGARRTPGWSGGGREGGGDDAYVCVYV